MRYKHHRWKGECNNGGRDTHSPGKKGVGVSGGGGGDKQHHAVELGGETHVVPVERTGGGGDMRHAVPVARRGCLL